MDDKGAIADLIELRADTVTRETIDVNDGIERVMGKRDLYARMLRQFRNEYRGGVTPITDALAAGHADTAHRLTTSLAGITGMIGAHRLHREARELEQALRLEQDISAALHAMALEFEKVLMLLDVLLDGRPPEGVPVQIKVRPLLADDALLSELKTLLRNADGAAIDLLDDSAASLRIILGAQLHSVMDAARRFDFAEALRLLDEKTG
jgi:HPt (histidine-containing phosphotransfer) domain-containing protein